ncbi:hypothetical protein J6590_005421 [Homalodisca vitripennis]|nr:hypothetical protein J6590_005421 [Homalodisca vitripennis]
MESNRRIERFALRGGGRSRNERSKDLLKSSDSNMQKRWKKQKRRSKELLQSSDFNMQERRGEKKRTERGKRSRNDRSKDFLNHLIPTYRRGLRNHAGPFNSGGNFIAPDEDPPKTLIVIPLISSNIKPPTISLHDLAILAVNVWLTISSKSNHVELAVFFFSV